MVRKEEEGEEEGTAQKDPAIINAKSSEGLNKNEKNDFSLLNLTFLSKRLVSTGHIIHKTLVCGYFL